MVTESQEVGKNINNSERNEDLMKNASINELKDLISESKANYKNSKTKFEKFRVLGKLETFLESVTSVDFGGSKDGAKAYFKLAEDYNELMEAVALEEGDEKTIKIGTDPTTNKEQITLEADGESSKPLEEDVKAAHDVEGEDIKQVKADVNTLEADHEIEGNLMKAGSDMEPEKMKESLQFVSKQKRFLEHCIKKLSNKLEFNEKCYNGLKKSKEAVVKNLINESMKNITNKSIQESQVRKLKNEMSKVKNIQEKLVNDNVNLINENQQVKKVQAGLYMTAKELAEENLSLQFKKNEEKQ
jgi:hypothetical protein